MTQAEKLAARLAANERARRTEQAQAQERLQRREAHR